MQCDAMQQIAPANVTQWVTSTPGCESWLQHVRFMEWNRIRGRVHLENHGLEIRCCPAIHCLDSWMMAIRQVNRGDKHCPPPRRLLVIATLHCAPPPPPPPPDTAGTRATAGAWLFQETRGPTRPLSTSPGQWMSSSMRQPLRTQCKGTRFPKSTAQSRKR